MNINILLDTNIFIKISECESNIETASAEMSRLVDRLSYHVFCHPIQKEEFERDPDLERKKKNLIHLKYYNELRNPPVPTAEEIAKLGWPEKNENDRVDNCLLYALHSNCVHFLITEDKGLLSKARSAGLEERAFRLDDFIYYLEQKADPSFHVPVGIEEVFLYQLELSDSFWISLRGAYKGFDEWLQKASREQRKVWCIREGRKPLAVCIYKTEEPEPITDDEKRLSGKILKLCTFKVGEELRGKKIGERLLFTAFKYAYERQYDYVYLHTDPKRQARLIDLLCDFGFELFGTYKGDEVYIKKMQPPAVIPPNISALDFVKMYYPNFLYGEQVQKFIVPIRPEFHNELFPDVSDDADTLFAVEFCKEKAQSNTIKKAYLCHAITQQIRPGDILLFYRSIDRRCVEVLGVVETTFRSQDPTEIQSRVAKRTVFIKEDLENIAKKSTLVVLFRVVRITRPIKASFLESIGLRGSFQSIRQISHQAYLQIRERL